MPLQHVGLYVYRRDFLLSFIELERTPAEQSEELEQLRVLENGHRIRVAEIENWKSVPVDVPEDVPIVEAALAKSSKLNEVENECEDHGGHGPRVGKTIFELGAMGGGG